MSATEALVNQMNSYVLCVMFYVSPLRDLIKIESNTKVRNTCNSLNTLQYIDCTTG